MVKELQKVREEKNDPLKNWFGFVSCSVFGGLSELLALLRTQATKMSGTVLSDYFYIV